MASLNQCNFIGNLGADPEIKYLNDETPVCNISLAVSESWKAKDGTPQERTEWVRASAFGKPAEIIGQYAEKGASLFISGKMQTRKWQDQDGNDRYTTEIRIRDFQFLGSRGDKQGGQRRQQASQQPQQQSFDDELPF